MDRFEEGLEVIVSFEDGVDIVVFSMTNPSDAAKVQPLARALIDRA